MLDQAIQSLIGHIEWAHAVPFPGGQKIVFRVDGTLRGLRLVPGGRSVTIRPLAYHDALKAAGSVEAQSRERGETPVNLLSEAERDTLGLLRGRK